MSRAILIGGPADGTFREVSEPPPAHIRIPIRPEIKPGDMNKVIVPAEAWYDLRRGYPQTLVMPTYDWVGTRKEVTIG
jgi:hypothetical protein